MTKTGVTITIVIMLAIVFVVIGTYCIVEAENANKTYEKTEECQHEFVITSKYNWFLDKYKTISKCIKCGEEI